MGSVGTPSPCSGIFFPPPVQSHHLLGFQGNRPTSTPFLKAGAAYSMPSLGFCRPMFAESRFSRVAAVRLGLPEVADSLCSNLATVRRDFTCPLTRPGLARTGCVL